MAVVGTFLIWCAVVLAVGCAGVRSGASKQEEQERTETTKEQGRSSGAASEEARCGRTRTIDLRKGEIVADSSVQPGDPEAIWLTNDVAGCPSGGLLPGTDKPDQLAGEDGEDEVRGLGGSDKLSGGSGTDTIYGGPGSDEMQPGGWVPLEFSVDRSKNLLHGGPGRDYLDSHEAGDVLYGDDGNDDLWGGGGEDVLYGGDGNDSLGASYGGRFPDKLYCGKG